MLSDGQQSLLYLTTVLALHEVGRSLLCRCWSFNEEKYRPAVFTMLAFEEPENSLSPFYLGRVMKLLRTSAGSLTAKRSSRPTRPRSYDGYRRNRFATCGSTTLVVPRFDRYPAS